MKNTIISFFLISFPLFSQDFQNKSNAAAEPASFTAVLENRILNGYDNTGRNVFTKKFNNPSLLNADLDFDGIDEYIVIDSIALQNTEPSYKIFVFNTVDSFYTPDSINSGGMYPYFEVNNETGEAIIISGNSYFDKFNSNTEFFFSPINCWRYEDCKLILCNEEAYDFLISENDALIDFIENCEMHRDSCAFSKEILGAVASAYINFLNAGEKAKASQFLKGYYKCSDINQLKEEFQKLLEQSERIIPGE